MCLCQAEKPMILKELVGPTPMVETPADPRSFQGLGPENLIHQAEPHSSFDPLSEGLQHALCPNRTFHPVPFYRTGFSRLFSPFLEHCLGGLFVRYGSHASTFLHPFAPRALPRFPAPMGALTPAGKALRTHAWGNEHLPCFQQVSLVHIARPSMHSVTKHLARPAIASPLPSQRGRLPGLYPGLDFALNPQARRYARPNRVRIPTDCMFASGCSPPRLTATQLPLATGSGHLPDGDFHPADRACSQAHGFPLPRE